jgi:hypothetical protein
LGASLITRSAVNDDASGIRDLLANFGYTYNFGGNKR